MQTLVRLPSTAKFRLNALAQYLRCRRVERHCLLLMQVQTHTLQAAAH
jgi:hypothetical protein